MPNTCAHVICRTTEPCRYGNPTLSDPIHERDTSDNGLATWQGDRDPLTGERVLTAWAMPKVPSR